MKDIKIPLRDYVERRLVIFRMKCEKCKKMHRFVWMYHYEDIYEVNEIVSGVLHFYGCRECFRSKNEFFNYIYEYLPSLRG